MLYMAYFPDTLNKHSAAHLHVFLSHAQRRRLIAVGPLQRAGHELNAPCSRLSRAKDGLSVTSCVVDGLLTRSLGSQDDLASAEQAKVQPDRETRVNTWYREHID